MRRVGVGRAGHRRSRAELQHPRCARRRCARVSAHATRARYARRAPCTARAFEVDRAEIVCQRSAEGTAARIVAATSCCRTSRSQLAAHRLAPSRSSASARSWQAVWLDLQASCDRSASSRPKGAAPDRSQAMLLMIDNYDCFTFNLVQYFGELGEEVRVFRNDEITRRRHRRAASPTRLVLSPGPCSPAEAGVCVRGDPGLRRQAADPRRVPGPPGDRRGARRQDRARAAADARQDQRDHDRRARRLRRPAASSSRVIRYHSLVDRARHAARASSRSPPTSDDGEIMGVRHRELRHEAPLEGVQFHPESILTEHGHAMLQELPG